MNGGELQGGVNAEAFDERAKCAIQGSANMRKLIEILVTVKDGANLHEVALRLGKAGVSIKEELGEIGCITGDAEVGSIPRLKSIDGVANVERSEVVQLPPPDSAIT